LRLVPETGTASEAGRRAEGEGSDIRRGIVARAREAGCEYTISLADLAFVDRDAESAEWQVYKQWPKR